MIWSKQRFQHSFELFPRVLKEVAPLLLPISLSVWGLEYTVSYLNKARFEDPYNSSMALILIAGLTGVIIQSFGSVVGLLYVARSTQRQSHNGTGDHPWVFLKKNFHQSLIEYLRAFLSTGIYTVFLIIPGLIRFTQLIFAVLISAFDPAYQRGEKDALKESSRLVKGKFTAISLWISLELTLPPVMQEIAKSAGVSTPISVLLYATSWLLALYFAIYFSLTFFARHSLLLERS